MKTGLYFCRCGTNISDRIAPEKVRDGLHERFPGLHFSTVDFLCSDQGVEALVQDIRRQGIERVVISACSPREHETTFMKALAQAGLNPYLMQMANVREQIAWVTDDPGRAVEKTVRVLSSAIARVQLHEELRKKEIDICPDLLVIGAGPAGLKAALTLAQAGRKVVLVEKAPLIGGMPVRYEELFPNLECGPCMLEPLMAEVLHGDCSGNIELLTLAEVTDVLGSYGNFEITIRQNPRYLDTETCIGCGECIEPCPVSADNPYDYGLSRRKAISLPFAGALPNAPALDPELCIRLQGGQCSRCSDACPVEGAIRFDDKGELLKRTAGALIVATGSALYDCSQLPALGYGRLDNVCTAAEFERILASNGPTEGRIATRAGTEPARIVIVHCVGSLDADHREYCSGICCQYAFKFNHMITAKLPGAQITHLHRELVFPGKEAFGLYGRARSNPNARFIRFETIGDLKVWEEQSGLLVRYRDSAGREGTVPADMVLLCPAVVPAVGSAALGRLLDTSFDRFGFFGEFHGRLDSARSTVRGIFIAGSCQAPMDIQPAMNQGMAAAGYALSGLVAGRKLEIDPVTAVLDESRCSGCRVCPGICPYKAISFDEERKRARINELLCQGCGTCVAACPAAAIRANHFTGREILAEIREALR